jgi:hypothetical protein
MFAYALGCSLLTMLLAAPAVADSSGHVFCRDSAVDTAAVITTTDQRNDHGPLDVEFPRRVMTVWFYRPVKIGDRVLMGPYIIEHDDARMARDRPCTHIYAATDARLPAVAFHCRHLTRPRANAPTVVVRSLGEANGMTELLAFQFAGETAAHGVPITR